MKPNLAAFPSGGGGPVILDHQGRPLAMSGLGQPTSYSAAGFGRELASWNPLLLSPDSELHGERDTIVARTRDLIRNHGIASGAVQTHLDNVIGIGLKLSAKPDYVALGIDADVAHDWARMVEAKFNLWYLDNLGFYSDAARRTNGPTRQVQGYRSFLVNGEILATAEWVKRPGSKYRTCIQMIDSDRLSNARGVPNTDLLIDGVHLDPVYGAATAYDIRTKHPGDYATLTRTPGTWKTINREKPWGRANLIHIYDQERPGQTRGKTGFVSVISDLKMMKKFQGITLQSAIVNAIYAAVIESSLDGTNVSQALGARTGALESPIQSYMEGKAGFHSTANVRFDGVKIPHLYPGEKLNLLSPEHPGPNFASFEEALLRHIAAGTNLSYEQLSKDYSKTNYSSARAALMEVWRFINGRRLFISAQQAQFEYVLWLEEAIDIGDVILPPGAPDFYEAKNAWCRSRWIGPGRMHIDPMKESKADQQNYALGVTTLEELCAERGLNYEDVLTQRKRELDFMAKIGIKPSDLAGAQPTQNPVADPADGFDNPNDSGAGIDG